MASATQLERCQLVIIRESAIDLHDNVVLLAHVLRNHVFHSAGFRLFNSFGIFKNTWNIQDAKVGTGWARYFDFQNLGSKILVYIARAWANAKISFGDLDETVKIISISTTIIYLTMSIMLAKSSLVMLPCISSKRL